MLVTTIWIGTMPSWEILGLVVPCHTRISLTTQSPKTSRFQWTLNSKISQIIIARYTLLLEIKFKLVKGLPSILLMLFQSLVVFQALSFYSWESLCHSTKSFATSKTWSGLIYSMTARKDMSKALMACKAFKQESQVTKTCSKGWDSWSCLEFLSSLIVVTI